MQKYPEVFPQHWSLLHFFNIASILGENCSSIHSAYFSFLNCFSFLGVLFWWNILSIYLLLMYYSRSYYYCIYSSKLFQKISFNNEYTQYFFISTWKNFFVDRSMKYTVSGIKNTFQMVSNYGFLKKIIYFMRVYNHWYQLRLWCHR